MNHKRLKLWFQEEKRSFPWRENPTPYRVWVSEVMLQQTRASVVVPYFERWVQRFPDIETLASAPLDEVIKLWEGLGYYSRARSLHEGAKFLLEHCEGKLPQTREELSKVKGIGPYTSGAILSFAFHKKAAAVDGNVNRVVSRLYAIEGGIDTKVEELLPDSEPWVIMEALIELGAKVCTPKPKCLLCPVREGCVARKAGLELELPRKVKRAKTSLLTRWVWVVECRGEFLVQKQTGKKVMADLFEFPYSEKGEEPSGFYPAPLKKMGAFDQVTHTFTRYRATLFPTLWQAREKQEIAGFDWVPKGQLESLPFSAGHRQILGQLLEAYADLTH